MKMTNLYERICTKKFATSAIFFLFITALLLEPHPSKLDRKGLEHECNVKFYLMLGLLVKVVRFAVIPRFNGHLPLVPT